MSGAAITVTAQVLTLLLTCALAGLGTPWVLRRLPQREPGEPDAAQADADHRDAGRPDPDATPRYRELATPRFVASVVLACAVIMATAVWLLPYTLWPAWIVLATAGVLLGAIDTVTTWLPNALMHPTWVAVAVAAGIEVALGAPWLTVVRMAVIAAAWGLVFWAVWLLSRRQIGFGDVRLAFALGAIAGSIGWTAGYVCLLLGTVVGAAWGIVHRLRRGRDAPPFAYGAALVIGCWLGLLVLGSV